jgi:hypothetical protein
MLSHLGLLGGPFEPSKLIVGRFNGMVGKAMEMIHNEDFKGKYIVDPQDNVLQKTMDGILHFLPLPISFNTFKTAGQMKEWSATQAGMALMGASDAPASAKRSVAENYMYAGQRKENKGSVISHEKDENRMEISRAMYAIAKGDHSLMDTMVREGRISPETLKHQMERARIIDNKINPNAKSSLETGTHYRSTMKLALETYEKADKREKIKLRPILRAKFNNLMERNDKSLVEKAQFKERMKLNNLL